MPIGQRSTTPAMQQEIWSAATRYIDAQLAEPLSLPDIARAAITSPRQLQRVFAAVGGTSVSDYLKEARMRRAEWLVLVTDAPVAEIAGAVGYGHASSFIKAFRVRHGATPLTLRLAADRRSALR